MGSTAIDKKACNGLLLRVNQIGRSLRPSRLTTWRRARAGARWCPTGPGRRRTASLPTWWWDWALVRSRLELHAGRRDWPSITSSSGLKKNLAPTPNMPEPTSDKEFRAGEDREVKRKLMI